MTSQKFYKCTSEIKNCGIQWVFRTISKKLRKLRKISQNKKKLF